MSEGPPKQTPDTNPNPTTPTDGWTPIGADAAPDWGGVGHEPTPIGGSTLHELIGDDVAARVGAPTEANAKPEATQPTDETYEPAPIGRTSMEELLGDDLRARAAAIDSSERGEEAEPEEQKPDEVNPFEDWFSDSEPERQPEDYSDDSDSAKDDEPSVTGESRGDEPAESSAESDRHGVKEIVVKGKSVLKFVGRGLIKAIKAGAELDRVVVGGGIDLGRLVVKTGVAIDKKIIDASGKAVAGAGKATGRGAAKSAKAVYSGASATGRAAKSGASATGKAVRSSAKATGRAAKSGARSTRRAAKSGARAVKRSQADGVLSLMSDVDTALGDATINPLIRKGQSVVAETVGKVSPSAEKWLNTSYWSDSGIPPVGSAHPKRVKVYSDAGRAALDTFKPAKPYSPIKGFAKKHRTDKNLRSGLPSTAGKVKFPGDPGYKPGEGARTSLQQLAAERAQLRSDKISKARLAIHEIESLYSLYGPMINDIDAVRAELAKGRYTRGEKKAMLAAARRVAGHKFTIDRTNALLERQKAGNDIAGKAARIFNPTT